jgi:flagellar motor switch protein FliN/FliY
MAAVDLMSAVKKVDVEISVVLGKAVMPIHQLLKMGRGAVIELDANQDDPVLVYANNRMIARGEIIVSGEKIAVSITDTLKAYET